MRLRNKASPLVLLLLPALAAALTPQNPSHKQILEVDSAALKKDKAVPVATSTPLAGLSVKPAVGTKDAPVDGLDGKPHAGPFVDTTPSKDTTKKKSSAGVEDVKEKPLPASLQKLKDQGISSDEDLASIPEKNDGVMNDVNRATPKKGTTGTEGGVSERTRKDKSLENQIGEGSEKKVDPPKEAPPLPHSEEEVLKESPTENDKTATREKTVTLTGKPKGAQGLEKPKDLPGKPAPAAPISEENLKPKIPFSDGKTTSPKTPSGAAVTSPGAEETLIQPLHSFVLSFTMIIFSEIGDKTFLVAVVMSMRHPRVLVFSAALSALFAMTVLSALLGHAAPTLLPKELTAFAAAILFLIFGAKMLREGFAMDPNLGVNEEMKEVEGEIDEKEHEDKKMGRRKSSLSVYALESGRGRRSGDRPKAPVSPPSSDDEDVSPTRRQRSAKKSFGNAMSGLTNLLGLLLSPAWVNTFVMTFTGEWGDRSQIATIAMAAGQDYWWVIAGAVTGHAICTGLAVIAGSLLAGRIRLRVGESRCFLFLTKGTYANRTQSQSEALLLSSSLALFTFSKPSTIDRFTSTRALYCTWASRCFAQSSLRRCCSLTAIIEKSNHHSSSQAFVRAV